MASGLNHLIVCSLLVVAASAFREQLLQQILNPSPAACRNSPLLVSLGVCDRYLHVHPRVPGRETHGEQEVEQEVGEPVEQEQEAGEPVEQEQEAGEPQEQEQEAGEPFEQEASEPVEQEASEPVEQEGGAEQQEFEPQAGLQQMIQQRIDGVYGGPSLCGPRLFTCHAVKKCVPKSLVCNGVDNCGDGSDERNCRFRPYRS